jgi:hypothetical protein
MKNLPRWIFASVASHFETISLANSIPYFVESANERSDESMEVSHAEIRMTGPYIKEVSRDQFHVETVINVLLTSIMDISGNAYEIIQWAGIFQSAMLDPIPVYKLGNGADDTGHLIGCLRNKKSRYDMVKVYHFGQSDITDRVSQSEVDAIYEFDVTRNVLEQGGILLGDVTSNLSLTQTNVNTV